MSDLIVTVDGIHSGEPTWLFVTVDGADTHAHSLHGNFKEAQDAIIWAIQRQGVERVWVEDFPMARGLYSGILSIFSRKMHPLPVRPWRAAR